MPTYGSQLLAQKNRANYVEPNLDPIHSGLSARQARHDATQAGYAKYVDGIVQSDTLDPVEKQRRLDSLRDQTYKLWDKYDGNISNAKDEFLNTIIENRKDPYWQADAQRTKAYRDLTSNVQKMGAEGDIALIKDAQGNYISNYQDQFKNLTDEFGNYRPMTDYNVQAEKQLDYEAPLRKAFEQIKPNINSIVGRVVSDGELSSLIGKYVASGTTGSTNPNIDRAIGGIIENYMSTPEWKQLSGRYGDGAYGELQKLTNNVADQYRYTQNKVGFNSAATKMMQGDKKKPSKGASVIDSYRSPVTPTGSDRMIFKKDYTDESGNPITFDQKYKYASKLFKDGVISADDMKKQVIGSVYSAAKTVPGEINIEESIGNIMLRIDEQLKEAGVSDNERISGLADVQSMILNDIDVKELQKDMEDYKSTIDFYKQYYPETKNMSAQQIGDIVNSNINTMQSDIIHTMPNTALTFLGGQDLFNSEKTDGHKLWKNRDVYYRDKGSNKWEKAESSTYIGVDKKGLFDKVSRPSASSDIKFDSEYGTGHYAANEDVEVFIPATSNVNEYFKPLEELENTESDFRSLGNKDVFKSMEGYGSSPVMIKSMKGPLVIEFPESWSKDKSAKKVQEAIDNGHSISDIINYYGSIGRLSSVDEYNAKLKNTLSQAIESTSNTKE